MWSMKNRMGLKLPMTHRGIQLDARGFGSRFIHRAVMLSEALQRNAKHEARLSNSSGCFRWRIDPDLIRDGKPGLADFVPCVAASLRSE
jgi:hypothetical protein